MKKKKRVLHQSIRNALQVSEDMSDEQFFDWWDLRSNRVCKPCWELKYCPYGPLVEQSPLLPITRESKELHNAYLSKCLETGKVGSDKPLDDNQRQLYTKFVEGIDPDDYESDPTGEITIMQLMGRGKSEKLTKEAVIQSIEQMKESLQTGIDGYTNDISEEQYIYFEETIKNYDPNDYPTEIPKDFLEAQCTVFGHICPAIFNAEQITETEELRRSGRYISFKVKIRVVRRDNYTCQHCSKHLKDNEVEFDHIIPVSKGGSSEEHNIRLTCFDCNRSKSDKVTV